MWPSEARTLDDGRRRLAAYWHENTACWMVFSV